MIAALILILTAYPCANSWASAPSWIPIARTMVETTGAVRQQRVSELKHLPTLTDELKQTLQVPSLKTEFFLALEVISTLQLKSLWPEVLTCLDSDNSGYAIHTLNVLATSDLVAELLPKYRSRALDRATSPAVRMAAIDSLARMGKFLRPPDLESLIVDPVPEIRLAALHHARTALFKTADRELLDTVRKALTASPYQLRIQAIHLIQELAPKTRTRMRVDIANQCKGEARTEVQDVCREVLQ